MNASSNPFALIGLAGNNVPSSTTRAPGSLAQPSESGEATFVDSLSSVLTAPLVLPVMPVAEQAATDFGMFAGTLTDGPGPDNGSFLLGKNFSDLGVTSSLPGDGTGRAGDLSRPITPVLERLAGEALLGSQTQSAERPGGPVAGANPDLAGGRQRQAGAGAVQFPLLSQPDELNLSMTVLPGERPIPSVMASLTKTSSPLNAVQQPSSMPPVDGQTSTIAIASTTRLRPNGPPAEPTLPQQQQFLSKSTDRPSAGKADSNLVLRPEYDQSKDLPTKLVNVDPRPSSDQFVKAPILHPAFVQQAQEHFTTNNVHLTAAKAGGQTAETPTVNGTPIVNGTSAKLLNSANLPNANSIELDAIEGVSRSSASAEVFLTETGSLDPVGAIASKPTAQTAQPPSAQIAVHIARAIPQGIDRFSIQLHPAELGMVEIKLDFAEEGRVSALITAERPETLEMLQRDSRSIERTLNNAGLSLENGGLSFSLKQEQNQHGQGFNAPSQQQSSTSSGDYGRPDGGDDQLTQQPISVSSQRLLDIRT